MEEPRLGEGDEWVCPNGGVSVTPACAEAEATGFQGEIDGEAVLLEPSTEAVTPGTISVSRRACGGGPLTFTVTLALAGGRAGDTLAVHANATSDCFIQGFYVPSGGDAEAVSVTLRLGVWEESIGPSVVLGELTVTGTAGGAAPALLEGSFTLVTEAIPCVG